MDTFGKVSVDEARHRRARLRHHQGGPVDGIALLLSLLNMRALRAKLMMGLAPQYYDVCIKNGMVGQCYPNSHFPIG